MTLSVGTSAALRMISARAAVPDLPSLWCYYAPGSYITGAGYKRLCELCCGLSQCVWKSICYKDF